MAFRFPEKALMKKVTRDRLEAEGRFYGAGGYCSVRAQLIHSGIDMKIAWRVALYPFDPLDGTEPELTADPMYAEIAANWKNGKYLRKDGTPIQFSEFKKMPCGMTDFSQMEEMEPESAEIVKQIVKEVKRAPLTHKEKWYALEEQVRALGKSCDEATSVRWVVDNYLRAEKDPSSIDPNEVPGMTAITLMYLTCSGGIKQLSDLTHSVWVKLMPDKKSIEMGKGFKDDGRTLTLLKDFEDSLDDEPAEVVDEAFDELDDDLDDLEGEDAA